MRVLLASMVALTTAGCTAGWDKLVRYSPDPAVEGETPELGVYATILSFYTFGHTEAMVVVADSTDGMSLAASVGGLRGVVRGHWADTLKNEVSAALRDPGRAQFSSYDELERAARLYGVHLSPLRAVDVPTDGSPIPRIWIWRAGFNTDSTIAAVQVQFWCGMLCAHGSTYLLARRPGFRWRIWQEVLHWIS